MFFFFFPLTSGRTNGAVNGCLYYYYFFLKSIKLFFFFTVSCTWRSPGPLTAVTRVRNHRSKELNAPHILLWYAHTHTHTHTQSSDAQFLQKQKHVLCSITWCVVS